MDAMHPKVLTEGFVLKAITSMVAAQTKVITYSPALTLVPTYECFNRCTYCNFRVDSYKDEWMSLSAVSKRLAAARSQSIIEILVLSGEVHPRSDRRSAWLQHIYAIAQLALEAGFLPHTNVGPLSESEMAMLKQVNASMGLMLEQLTPALLRKVHRHAPSKDPNLRLQQLEQAGRLKIPFTTGLLLGIGETENDRVDTLKAIAASHDRWGHIQEVILQPHQPGDRQANALPSFSANELVAFIEPARQYLPADITIQIPPNLVINQQCLLTAIAKGANDLGGLGPVDEVNPNYQHPSPRFLQNVLQAAGWTLRPRLPVYPQYDEWLTPPLQDAVRWWRNRLSTTAPI